MHIQKQRSFLTITAMTLSSLSLWVGLCGQVLATPQKLPSPQGRNQKVAHQTVVKPLPLPKILEQEQQEKMPTYLRYVAKKYIPYERKMKRYALKPAHRHAYPNRRGVKYKIRDLATLQAELKKRLAHRQLKGAKLGLVVMTSKGQVLFDYNGSQPFIPASNVKLLTIAAAFHYLGPHYRFVTKIYGDRKIDDDGTLRGNLYIQGSGDPSLRSEDLWKISRELKLLGLHKVTGRVYFDTSLFDDEHFGPGWEDHAVQPGERYCPYLAPISALSVNYNVMGVSVRPARKVGEPASVILEPHGYYVHKIINKTKTTSQGKFRVKIKMLGYRNWREHIELEGSVPRDAKTRVIWRRVTHPGWYSGFEFAQILKSQRIQIHEWPRKGKVPGRAIELYRHYSTPLGAILQEAGKISSNFTTEQVTKLIGAKVYGKPGTWAKGVNAIRSFLQLHGIAPNSYKLFNGSGLSRGNRLYPMLFATLLQKMLGSLATRPDFIVAQPIAGYDGTLRWRMKHSTASGVLRAKTGTLDGVSSLSGYVETTDRQLLIFAINMNGTIRQIRYFRRVQNQIGEVLARLEARSIHPSMQR